MLACHSVIVVTPARSSRYPATISPGLASRASVYTQIIVAMKEANVAGTRPVATPWPTSQTITAAVTSSGAVRRATSGRTATSAKTVSSAGSPGGRSLSSWVTARTARTTGTATSSSDCSDAPRTVAMATTAPSSGAPEAPDWRQGAASGAARTTSAGTGALVRAEEEVGPDGRGRRVGPGGSVVTGGPPGAASKPGGTMELASLLRPLGLFAGPATVLSLGLMVVAIVTAGDDVATSP